MRAVGVFNVCVALNELVSSRPTTLMTLWKYCAYEGGKGAYISVRVLVGIEP